MEARGEGAFTFGGLEVNPNKRRGCWNPLPSIAEPLRRDGSRPSRSEALPSGDF